MTSVECAKREIRRVVAGSRVPEDSRHADNTLEWLLRLQPDASVAMQLAALAHDIDRAIEDIKVIERQVDIKIGDAIRILEYIGAGVATHLMDFHQAAGHVRNMWFHITNRQYRAQYFCAISGVGCLEGIVIAKVRSSYIDVLDCPVDVVSQCC